MGRNVAGVFLRNGYNAILAYLGVLPAHRG